MPLYLRTRLRRQDPRDDRRDGATATVPNGLTCCGVGQVADPARQQAGFVPPFGCALRGRLLGPCAPRPRGGGDSMVLVRAERRLSCRLRAPRRGAPLSSQVATWRCLRQLTVTSEEPRFGRRTETPQDPPWLPLSSPGVATQTAGLATASLHVAAALCSSSEVRSSKSAVDAVLQGVRPPPPPTPRAGRDRAGGAGCCSR